MVVPIFRQVVQLPCNISEGQSKPLYNITDLDNSTILLSSAGGQTVSEGWLHTGCRMLLRRWSMRSAICSSIFLFFLVAYCTISTLCTNRSACIVSIPWSIWEPPGGAQQQHVARGYEGRQGLSQLLPRWRWVRSRLYLQIDLGCGRVLCFEILVDGRHCALWLLRWVSWVFSWWWVGERDGGEWARM